jgi:hypothetical protein
MLVACLTAEATFGTSSREIGVRVGYHTRIRRVRRAEDCELTMKSISSLRDFFFFVPRRPSFSTSSVMPKAAEYTARQRCSMEV